LYLGHRLSHDFDFYGPDFEDPEPLVAILQSVSTVAIRQSIRSNLRATVNGVNFTCFKYPYPLLDPPIRGLHGCPIAQIRDLAAMKIIAVSQRNKRRDFIDLDFLDRGPVPLAQAVDLAFEKYRSVKLSRYHILRSLTYFDLADKDEMPHMLVPFDWGALKRRFVATAEALSRTS
jgi:hypothetical protein